MVTLNNIWIGLSSHQFGMRWLGLFVYGLYCIAWDSRLNMQPSFTPVPLETPITTVKLPADGGVVKYLCNLTAMSRTRIGRDQRFHVREAHAPICFVEEQYCVLSRVFFQPFLLNLILCACPAYLKSWPVGRPTGHPNG